MKARPILFNGAMVRALLDGRKTQTRRAVKITHRTPGLAACLLPPVGAPRPSTAAELCPYGQPGDQLWVRETWRTDSSLDNKAPGTFSGWPVRYEADGEVLRHGAFYGDTKGKTRPSLFMPRWFCRITLEIVSVRVERLQEISDADAWAEGIDVNEGLSMGCTDGAAIAAYSALWESINGHGSWDTNPWVWVVEFKKVTPC